MDKILFENKWVKVIERDGWYTFTQDTLTNMGVSILVVKGSRVLIRKENCPPHGGFIKTSITGTVEKGSSPLETAVKELKEETGFIKDPKDFIPLGWVFPTKQSDFKQFHFGVVLEDDDTPSGDIIGDGSKGEEGATTEWVTYSEAANINDPSIGAMLAKMFILAEELDNV